MKKSEIENLSKGPDLAGIRATLDECKDLKEHQGFQAFEKLAINYLDTLYDAIVKGGLDPLVTEYLRGQIYAIRQLLGIPDANIETAQTFVGNPVTPTPDDAAEMDDFIQGRYMNKGE
jgi:hypothetical protein